MKFSLITTEETQLYRRRTVVIFTALGLCVGLLLVRLWYLQVVRGDYYGEVARGNRIRVIPQEALRGIIYDRNGELLAFNRPAFNIDLVPEDAPNLERTLHNLAQVTETPYADLQKQVAANRSMQRFKPIQLIRDVGRKVADLVETYQEDLPGISVAIESKRLYPTAFLTSHVIGYVGEINEQQLERLPMRKLRSGHIVGHAGLERLQNVQLIGTDGGKQVEVDHVGRELRVLSKPVNPVPGNDIYLTLDLRLQRFVHAQMTGKRGTVIVMRPRTGEILSMVSFPDYDPNLFVGGIENQDWEQLTKGEEKPLFNKAVHGLYPPGSTFKMLVAMAGMDLGIIDRDTILNCPGSYRMGRKTWMCWKRTGHGDVNVVQAIQQSCNVYFYQLGLEVGVDNIRKYALMFGIGRPTEVELDGEKSGLLPSREWKERVFRERWYDGETVPISIGQGYLTVTPIQLLNYVNVIANRGLWVQPTLVRQVVSPDGVDLSTADELPRNSRLLPLKLEYFDVVREGMVRAVNADGGTGRMAQSRRFVIAGKTGTSQVVGRTNDHPEPAELEEDLQPHSLFVGFAPADNPRISVLVLVEHGRSGGQVAAPIARKIIEYDLQEIEPAPPAEVVRGDDRNSGSGFRQDLLAAFDDAKRNPRPQ